MFTKILSIYTVALLLVLGILGFAGAYHLKKDHIRNTEELLIKNVDQLKRAFKDISWAKNDPDMFCKKFGAAMSMRVTIIAFDGKVLGDSDANPNQMENHLSRSEIQKAIKGGYGSELRMSHTVQRDLLYVAKKLEGTGYIRLALPLKTLMHSFGNLFYTLMIVLFLSGLCMVMIGIYTTRLITQPLQKMTQFSKQLAQGNFDNILHYPSKDELGELASSLNAMKQQLSAFISNLSQEKQKLSAILANLYDGVLAVQKDKTILLCNESAKTIFGLTDKSIIEKKLFEIVLPTPLVASLEACLKSGEIHQTQIKIVCGREKYFECIISPLYGSTKEVSGSVAIFHDITELKQAEQMRVDFVANVSHELKTPLTSIRGYTDTLLNENSIADPRLHREFLTVIQENALRLTRLVEDLLTISHLESQPLLERKHTDLRKSVDTVLDQLNCKIKEKDIAIHADIRVPHWSCDSSKVEKALINLVHNAIQYNPPKSQVNIGTQSHPLGLCISVSDNGVGIASEHLPRIFERFYRIDKGRSRELGGTGLGLSIVKHVALLHGGSVEVKSTLGEGSTFSLILPA